jgi:thiopeptide-type bacteriocin biosynthesis protein
MVEGALQGCRSLRGSTIVQLPGELRARLGSPDFIAATRLANPMVGRVLDRALADGEMELTPLLKLVRYLIRSSTRVTPFGLFSGVAWATLSNQDGATTGRLLAGDTIAGRVKIDTGVLMSAAHARALLASPDLVVRRNELLNITPARIWLSIADAYGDSDRRSLSVQMTEPLQCVLSLLSPDARLSELLDALATQYPTRPRTTLEGFLDQLLSLNILVSADQLQVHEKDLEPASWVPDAWTKAIKVADQNIARHLIDQPDEFLDTVRETVDWDASKPVFHVDSALRTDSPMALPQEFGVLATEVADTLIRLDTTSCYPPYLTAYARCFVEEYGMNARVPLTCLLSQETGLGPPETYSYPDRDFPLPQPTDNRLDVSLSRTALLQSWIAQALAAGSLEVELSDEDLYFFAESTIGGRDDRPLVPGFDLCFTPMQSPGPGGNDWLALCSPVPSGPPGSFVGRFWDLMPADGQAGMHAAAAVWQRELPGIRIAELTYLPTLAKAMNVAGRAVLQPSEIAINVKPSLAPDAVIPLEQIAVGVNDEMLTFWDCSSGQEILAVQSSLLNLRMACNEVRFLLEASFNRFRSLSGFDWGPLEWASPFLPRLRHGRVVVRPATWSLRAAPELRAGRELTFEQFVQHAAEWRDRWRVPQHVYLAREDNRLYLDLDLRACLFDLWWAWKSSSQSQVTVCEIMPAIDAGFVENTRGEIHAGDIALTVERSDLPPMEPQSEVSEKQRESHGTRLATWIANDIEQVDWFGQPWLYAKYYGPRTLQNDVLLQLVSSVLADRDYFFIRYGDPSPHLRLRVRAVDWSADMKAMADIGDAMRRQGLVTNVTFLPYRRETARYGGPGCFAAAEEVFVESSRWVGTRVRELAARSTLSSQLAGAAIDTERLAQTLCGDIEMRQSFAKVLAGPTAGGPDWRELGRSIWDDLADPAIAVTPAPLVAALHSLGAKIQSADEDGTLTSPPNDIISSILHLHSNRLGIPRDDEQRVYGLWRRYLDRTMAERRSA